MNNNYLNLSTIRLALSGALIGIAIAGIVTQLPYHDIIGGLVGFAATIVAKARHIF